MNIESEAIYEQLNQSKEMGEHSNVYLFDWIRTKQVLQIPNIQSKDNAGIDKTYVRPHR